MFVFNLTFFVNLFGLFLSCCLDIMLKLTFDVLLKSGDLILN